MVEFADWTALHIGLCDGRHPIVQNASLLDANGTYRPNPTAGEDMNFFVFPAEVDEPLAFDEFRERVHDVLDYSHTVHKSGKTVFTTIYAEQICKVYLYVTGLSSLLTSFLWVWIHNSDLWNKVPLMLMHYDRDTGEYKEEYWG